MIGLLSVPFVLKLRRKEGSALQKALQFDWNGSVLFISSMTAILIPISWVWFPSPTQTQAHTNNITKGGIMYPWSSWRTLVPLLVGLFGLAGFIVWSRYLARDPILRGSLFKTRSALVSYITAILFGTILWSILYYMVKSLDQTDTMLY